MHCSASPAPVLFERQPTTKAGASPATILLGSVMEGLSLRMTSTVVPNLIPIAARVSPDAICGQQGSTAGRTDQAGQRGVAFADCMHKVGGRRFTQQAASAGNGGQEQPMDNDWHCTNIDNLPSPPPSPPCRCRVRSRGCRQGRRLALRAAAAPRAG